MKGCLQVAVQLCSCGRSVLGPLRSIWLHQIFHVFPALPPLVITCPWKTSSHLGLSHCFRTVYLGGWMFEPADVAAIGWGDQDIRNSTHETFLIEPSFGICLLGSCIHHHHHHHHQQQQQQHHHVSMFIVSQYLSHCFLQETVYVFSHRCPS